mmetsp:Transcript_53850/g.149485  ORF Transcript_53850/g.149485 Transcript_53850/m.149485 type:complete len:225 (+) Transcript_53850:126-800(+)
MHRLPSAGPSATRPEQRRSSCRSALPPGQAVRRLPLLLDGRKRVAAPHGGRRAAEAVRLRPQRVVGRAAGHARPHPGPAAPDLAPELRLQVWPGAVTAAAALLPQSAVAGTSLCGGGAGRRGGGRGGAAAARPVARSPSVLSNCLSGGGCLLVGSMDSEDLRCEPVCNAGEALPSQPCPGARGCPLHLWRSGWGRLALLAIAGVCEARPAQVCPGTHRRPLHQW